MSVRDCDGRGHGVFIADNLRQPAPPVERRRGRLLKMNEAPSPERRSLAFSEPRDAPRAQKNL
jgi:hypothetical protein